MIIILCTLYMQYFMRINSLSLSLSNSNCMNLNNPPPIKMVFPLHLTNQNHCYMTQLNDHHVILFTGTGMMS